MTALSSYHSPYLLINQSRPPGVLFLSDYNIPYRLQEVNVQIAQILGINFVQFFYKKHLTKSAEYGIMVKCGQLAKRSARQLAAQ